MKQWLGDSLFYHIYPLGACGAPPRNDFTSHPVDRLRRLRDDVAHLSDLGVDAVYLGPVFESTSHGYDTRDYFMIDRRLGDKESFRELVSVFHRNGIRVVLDGVFHHVGREFFAFENLRSTLRESPYTNWFVGVDFNGASRYRDPFSYAGWNGHYNLVKLNLSNHEVRSHLFAAVRSWIEDYGIDGLRIDAADYIDPAFLEELSSECRRVREGFVMIGEVIHGDYRKWVNGRMFDSVTNYESYKGLYSSHNDRNYFEIAFSLNRQFGSSGLYKDLPLYNFADNHDVDRIASTLANPRHVYPLYFLLFTMPGVPSMYYGSEFGIHGAKHDGSDAAMRPLYDRDRFLKSTPHPDLFPAIRKLARLRKQCAALRRGGYRELFVSHSALMFARELGDTIAIVGVNAGDEKTVVEWNDRELALRFGRCTWRDALGDGISLSVKGDRFRTEIWPNWGTVLIANVS